MRASLAARRFADVRSRRHVERPARSARQAGRRERGGADGRDKPESASFGHTPARVTRAWREQFRKPKALIASSKRLPLSAFAVVWAHFLAKVPWRCKRSLAIWSRVVFRCFTGKEQGIGAGQSHLPLIRPLFLKQLQCVRVEFPGFLNRELLCREQGIRS